MKQVIIILLILLLLYIIYKCINCSKTEGFVDRNRKNKVIDLLKGVNSEGERRDTLSEGVIIEKDDLKCIYNNNNIFEPKLQSDEYILGSMSSQNSLEDIIKNKDFPHKLNYIYDSSGKKIDYFKEEKDLTNHTQTQPTRIIINDNGKDGEIVLNYLQKKEKSYYFYKNTKIEEDEDEDDDKFLKLLGFEDPNITNATDMKKYVNDKFYEYDDNYNFKLKEDKIEIIYKQMQSKYEFINVGKNVNIPFLNKNELYSFLNKCGITIKSIVEINLLKELKNDELKLNIYDFTSDDKDINKKINDFYTSKPTVKETTRYKNKNIDLLYKLLEFQTEYLYQHKDIHKIISQYPNEKTDVNLYYYYYNDHEVEIDIDNQKELDKNKTFRYLGGLFSNNKELTENEKKKILKIPQRCLKESTESYTEWFYKEENLVIHPIYKTIVNVKSFEDPVYELKPCVQLQTKFRQQQKYYNDIKEKCKQYSKVNVENPIFIKTSEKINTEIKNNIIKQNTLIINEKKKTLEELKKEEIIKKNINRAYNRGRLNKYLNQKEENLYMLNKKMNNSKNSIDLNFYYSGDILNNCFDNLKDSSLSKEEKISKCNTIIENNLEKQKQKQNQEKDMLTTCKQTDFIRKDEVPCWGCTDIVMN